jgi:hypothetical protein
MRAFYCTPSRVSGTTVEWAAEEMSGPVVGPAKPLAAEVAGFPPRRRAYTKRTPDADVSPLADVVSDELEVPFARESMLEAVRKEHLAVANDLDYLVWGQKATYPVEVKEKTAAAGGNQGDWLGIDIGPFSKLAAFGAYGHDSLFIVREITDRSTRQMKAWRMIRFSDLCRACSWVYQGGGKNMLGGASAVVKVPLAAFQPLDRAHLDAL